MVSLEFSYTPWGSGSGIGKAIDVLSVTPAFDVEATEYSDINDNLRKILDTVHKVWEIQFGFLNVIDQDYFINMEIGSGLQMTYNSTVYNIKFLSFTPRDIGAKLKIERIEKET